MPRLLRLAAAGLVAAALSAPALAQTAKSPFTPEQEARLKEMIREYILENPEVVFEAIQILRKKQEMETANAAREAIKANRDKLQGAKELPIFGNPNGDVTIVEFFDYRCGYCKAVKPALDEVVKGDGKVRVVMKEFPILGPASTRAAMAALAAHKQGKYKEMHEALMAYKDGINDDVIFDIARRAGLNVERLRADMNAPDIRAHIEAVHALARQLNINGTPAFVIGDEIVPGAIGADEFRERLKVARAACAARKEALC